MVHVPYYFTRPTGPTHEYSISFLRSGAYGNFECVSEDSLCLGRNLSCIFAGYCIGNLTTELYHLVVPGIESLDGVNVNCQFHTPNQLNNCSPETAATIVVYNEGIGCMYDLLASHAGP